MCDGRSFRKINRAVKASRCFWRSRASFSCSLNSRAGGDHDNLNCQSALIKVSDTRAKNYNPPLTLRETLVKVANFSIQKDAS